MDMVSSFLHKVQKTGRINVRECTPGLDLLRHYGNETSGGALSARHLIRPVSNYVENGPPMNRKRAYQNLFLLSRQKNQKNQLLQLDPELKPSPLGDRFPPHRGKMSHSDKRGSRWRVAPDEGYLGKYAAILRPHQSPSVTASPDRGKPLGRCRFRKSLPPDGGRWMRTQ